MRDVDHVNFYLRKVNFYSCKLVLHVFIQTHTLTYTDTHLRKAPLVLSSSPSLLGIHVTLFKVAIFTKYRLNRE